MRKLIVSLIVTAVAVTSLLVFAGGQSASKPVIDATAIARYLGVSINADQTVKLTAALQQHHDAIAKANRDLVDQTKSLLGLTDAQIAKLAQGVDQLTGMSAHMGKQGHGGGHEGQGGGQEGHGDGHEGHGGH